MKTLLHRPVCLVLVFLIQSLFFNNIIIAQSCGNNDIGFNNNSATNTLTICSGTTGTTIDGGNPASANYQWQVSVNSISGPYTIVSPNPGDVQNWTVSSTYYNTAGTYFFRRVVSNSSGCNGNSDTVSLIVKFLPVVTNNGTNSANCVNTGSIILYGNAGVSPYTYSIDGTNYFAGNSFNNLAAGTYTGYAKDAIGCIGTKPGITITAAAALNVTATPRNASSCADDGSIELYRTGGVGPFTFSLDDVTYQASNTFNGLVDGTYTGWVKDSYGCKGSLTGIIVGKSAAVTVTATKTNTSACANTGVIQLFPGGGVPDYKYSLDNITYQASSLFTGLAAGTYTCWAKDVRGCTATVTISVGTNPAITITVTAFPRSTSSCINNGSIQIFKTGGTGPFSYSIDDITYQVSNTITGLAAGTYTAWVKDGNGCKGSLGGIVITQSAAVSVTERHTNTSTCANNGSISLTATSGVAPYSYSIDDITYQAGRSFSGLGAGNYTGWVKDVNGCKASVNLTIGLNPIVVNAFIQNASSCGVSNGSIQLFRTGGMGPFTYSINGTTFQSSNRFNGLTPSTFTAYVKDNSGCIGTLVINLGPQSSTISLTSGAGTSALATCKNTVMTDITYAIGGGGTGASITAGALPAGVTGSYNAGVFTISGTPTVTGSFNYTITTTGTCTQVTASGTILVNSAFTTSFTKTMASSCGGGTDGSITVSTTGGSSPYTYSWTGPGGFAASAAAVTDLATGDYDVIVSDAASACSKTIPAITIWQAQDPVVTNNGFISASCSATGSIILYGSYGVAPFTYSIDGSNYQSGNTFNNLSPATYTGYIKDLKGCIATKTIVVAAAAPISVTSYAWTAGSCGSANGKIQLFRTGGIGPYTYSLDGTNYQASPLFTALLPGLYRGFVKDSKGCVGSQLNINVGPNCPGPIAVAGNAKVSASTRTENGFIELVAYPNPSTAEFTLLLNGYSKERVIITVTDIFGTKVYQSSTVNKQKFSFGNNFKPGLYFVMVEQSGKKESIKLTKN